ncbi:mitochondrial sodium/calcium exchanger protein-like [Drosophila novamexicana]|uniref:mitochondrial sodium/calcium exchanger protein-like n=1 Tax=Drosophila novamexicana TaxID=47314 RepID=UPI0011E5CC2D|nr:mitochondrial sodium/calcium exchanger protein-like [Drosophila novamexicana]
MAMIEDEFRHFLSNTSCHSLMKVSYQYRCTMAQKLEECRHIISYFNYFEMMYCMLRIHDKTTEFCVMLLLFIVALFYVLLMSIVVDTFLAPALKVLSLKMHMNEYLAGVTILAFANSSPDLIANLMPIKENAALFTSIVSNALAILLLSGGMVCYLKPFKMDGHSTAQNLLFLLLSVELLRFIMVKGDSVTETESIMLLSVYVAYLVVNVADLLLVRYSIRKLRVEIRALRAQTTSQTNSRELKQKTALLLRLEQNEAMNFKKRNSHYFVKKGRNSSNSLADIFATPLSEQKPEQVDYETNRTMLHSRSNAKNRFLGAEFLETLNPFDAVEWKLSGCFGRLMIIMKMPLVLLITMFVPVVDYERCKHGWSKLLNCTQIVTNPFILITAVHSKFASVYKSWYVEFNLNYSKWSFCLTVPLAILVFLHARTDVPPAYHLLFITLSASSSLVIIVLCVNEIEVLNSIVGTVLNLSEEFVDITFGSMTNATIDLMSNFALAMQGYERMAFAASCAGPFFSIALGMGVALLFNTNVRLKGSSYWLNGEEGDNCYIFLLLAIVAQLWLCLTFNFVARRSVGIFSWTLFAVFLIYACVAEWDLVHDFTRDTFFEPQ